MTNLIDTVFVQRETSERLTPDEERRLLRTAQKATDARDRERARLDLAAAHAPVLRDAYMSYRTGLHARKLPVETPHEAMGPIWEGFVKVLEKVDPEAIIEERYADKVGPLTRALRRGLKAYLRADLDARHPMQIPTTTQAKVRTVRNKIENEGWTEKDALTKSELARETFLQINGYENRVSTFGNTEVEDIASEVDYFAAVYDGLLAETALSLLDGVEREVIRCAWGFYGDLGPMSFAQVGEYLQMHKSSVHRHHKEAMKKMRIAFDVDLPNKLTNSTHEQTEEVAA